MLWYEMKVLDDGKQCDVGGGGGDDDDSVDVVGRLVNAGGGRKLQSAMLSTVNKRVGKKGSKLYLTFSTDQEASRQSTRFAVAWKMMNFGK